MIKAAFLDVDGTLVDSNEFHVEAWRAAFEEAACTVSKQAIRKQIGKGADMLIPSLFPNLPKSLQQSIGKRQGEIFRSSYLQEVEAFPAATDFIAKLHGRGIEVVLASSAGQAEVEHYLDLLNARKWIAATTSKDDVENTKPAADIFEQALGKVAPIPARQAFAVGDTPYDAIAAGKCCIRTVGLRSGGFPDHELQRAGAIAIYDSIEQLCDAFDTLPLIDD